MQTGRQGQMGTKLVLFAKKEKKRRVIVKHRSMDDRKWVDG